MSFRLRVVILAVFVGAAIGVALAYFPEPYPQPLSYHQFADQRTLLGVPHALNVISNLPFLIVGVWGLLFMASAKSRRPDVFVERAERGPYWVYFVGLVLTAIGSAYYHADPINDRLTWDRMPLAITLMSLFTAVLAERLYWRFASWLLVPLVALGVGSVIYWHVSEVRGAGDMRVYLMVQFLPMLILPVLLVLFKPRYTGTEDLVASLGCYGIAKALEYFDGKIYEQAGFVSGHTLKHLVAGLAAFFILFMLERRREFPMPLAA